MAIFNAILFRRGTIEFKNRALLNSRWHLGRDLTQRVFGPKKKTGGFTGGGDR